MIRARRGPGTARAVSLLLALLCLLIVACGGAALPASERANKIDKKEDVLLINFTLVELAYGRATCLLRAEVITAFSRCAVWLVYFFGVVAAVPLAGFISISLAVMV